MTGYHSPDLELPPTQRRLDVHSADGTRLNVELYGPEQGRTVLLAHGWTCATLFWARQINALLADGLRVVAYDQRGHGASGRPGPAGATPEALAEDLAAVLAAVLAPDQQAVLGGHSMGAMTLIAFGRRYPEQLRSRVAAALIANTGMHDLLPRSRILPLPLPLAKLARPVLGRLLSLRVAGSPTTPSVRTAVKYISLSGRATEAEVDFCARIVTSCRPSARADFGRMLAGLNLDAEVAEFDVPTVVLTGTQDRLTPNWHARRLAAQVPRLVEFVELDGIGHMAPVQAADEVNDVLRRLVRDYLPAPVGPDQHRASLKVIDLTSRSPVDPSQSGPETDVTKETA